MNEKVKICLVSDLPHSFPDEGIYNFAQNLLYQWGRDYSVRALKIGADLSVNRLFLSWKLRKNLQGIRPDLIFYLSSSCGKVAALFRAKILKIYSPQSRVFVISLQPVNYRRLERRLLSLLVPDGIFIQSPNSKKDLEGITCPIYFLPSGVDTRRFVHVDAIQKKKLRIKYQVDTDAFIVLHVGHFNPGRNIQMLEKITRLKNVRVILVGSTSTRPDETLTHQLSQAGVLVIREFIPHIEELYQLADVYIFPVRSEDAAIGVPLSILEAMSCNLPIITTRFGGLPWMFQEDEGFYYFDNEYELHEMIGDVQRLKKSSTRKMVEPYDWRRVASGVLNVIQKKIDSL